MPEAKHTRKSVKDYVKPKAHHCSHKFAANADGKIVCVKCSQRFEPRDGSKKEKNRVRMVKRTKGVKMPPMKRSH